MATMPERLVAIYDAIFNGGKSMLHGESLQYQIDRAGERTWKRHLIGPFKDSKGKEYFTTPAQQAQYDALALARIEGNTAVIQNLVKALANVSGGESFDQAKLLAGIEAAAKAGAEAGTAAAIKGIDTTVTFEQEANK